MRHRNMGLAFSLHSPLLFLLLFSPLLTLAPAAQSSTTLHVTRRSPSDLEIGGELAGVPPGAVRYLGRDDLLAMPQVNFTVNNHTNNDTNFATPATLSGVKLEELLRSLGTASRSAVIVAICDDGYQAAYPSSYLAAHHPVLVLRVNGLPPEGWPRNSQDHSDNMGPYMISHSSFRPGFRILSYVDEPEIPWGVVRLEFRDEQNMFGAIAPRGPRQHDDGVQAGFRIAKQNCLRCHNAGDAGGQKSGRTWESLAALAAASPEYFANYVRSPSAVHSNAEMPGNSAFDRATLAALVAYFQSLNARPTP